MTSLALQNYRSTFFAYFSEEWHIIARFNSCTSNREKLGITSVSKYHSRYATDIIKQYVQ